MKKFTLTECESDGINLFVSEIVALPMVEAIYLVPYRTKIFEEYGIDIVTIYNKSWKYDTLITGTEKKRDTDHEFENLQHDIEKYDAIFNGSRLKFFSQDFADYLPFVFSCRERIAKKSLAAGIILFDRFGNLKEKQTEAQREFGIPSTVEITNIESIKPVSAPSLEYLKNK